MGELLLPNIGLKIKMFHQAKKFLPLFQSRLTKSLGKAMLPVARSGKVKIGQKVNIRLQNFPENEYGILRGVVSNISLVPVQTEGTVYYAVEISLPDKLISTYKKELPYLPNMQGQADIIADDMSLLERFVLPVKRVLTESFVLLSVNHPSL